MLFVPVANKDFFEVNPGAKAIEEFANLTSRQMTVVSLVADVDYDNPVRTLPELDRRTKACFAAGYGMEDSRPDKNARNIIQGKVATVEKAIAKYKELQYNEDSANLEALNRQIHEARELMSMDKIAAATSYKQEIDSEGNPKETKIIDAGLAIELATKAIKLGQGLDSLIETRDKLQARIKLKAPVTDITTFSAGDVLGKMTDPDLSLLDQVAPINRK